MKRTSPGSTSIVIAISPLITLMKDKVTSLSTRGLAVGYVSLMKARTKKERKMKDGQYQLVLFSPEALLTVRRWRELLQGTNYSSRIVAFICGRGTLYQEMIRNFITSSLCIGHSQFLLCAHNNYYCVCVCHWLYRLSTTVHIMTNFFPFCVGERISGRSTQDLVRCEAFFDRMYMLWH